MSSTADATGGRSLQVFELLRTIARWGISAPLAPAGAAPVGTASPLGTVPFGTAPDLRVPLTPAPDKTPAPAAGDGTETVEAADAAVADPAVPAPAARVRTVVLPQRRRYAAAMRVDASPFDFEQARLDLLHALALHRVDGHAVFDDRDILHGAILEDSGKARMFVEELVRRITADTEKTYDVVASFGEFGAVFGARVADALIEHYDNRPVTQRFLEAFTLQGEDDAADPRTEYRLRRSRSDVTHPLSGKRIVFAVPTVTPENWPEVLRQAQFLRGPQTNSDSVRIVAIARVGQLRTDEPHGLKIDAIVDYR